MAERITDEDLELLGELGVETTPVAKGGRTAREQRIVAGFEEIERFFEEHGRAPQHGEGRDIFERLYAVRLDRIRASEECRAVLSALDRHGLLTAPVPSDAGPAVGEVNDDELLAALGVEPDADDSDVTKLVHVRSNAERQAAEDVARRAPCADFETFRPIFEQVQRDLEAGVLRTVKHERKNDGENLKPGDLFIIGGQKALIASEGESVDKPLFPGDRRLRVIFDNATEANLWLRSLKRALYEEGNRRILGLSEAAPLFSDQIADDDTQVGYIYVLRSKSDHPFVAEHRSVLHKIGVTGGDVKTRVANAKKDPTYLLADVDIVATYMLANINRKRFEALLHKIFASARLDMELKDRFGFDVAPKEWFLVPLPVIDEAIEKLKQGTIGGYRYDPKTASLAPA